MIKFLFLILFSLPLWAVEIPVNHFDQTKLEYLLRNIPAALVSAVDKGGFIRKNYAYPKMNDKGFKIECEADHYFSSPVPSVSSCTLTVESSDATGPDQILVKITDPAVAGSLYHSMSYANGEFKEFFSHERYNGRDVNGHYRDLFRYAFLCKKDSCELTVATKVNPDPDGKYNY